MLFSHASSFWLPPRTVVELLLVIADVWAVGHCWPTGFGCLTTIPSVIGAHVCSIWMNLKPPIIGSTAPDKHDIAIPRPVLLNKFGADLTPYR